MGRLLFLLCCFAIPWTCRCQNRPDSTKVAPADTLQTAKADTSVVVSDSVRRIKSMATRYVPRKALLYSAILPGSGQIYVGKYWKVPLVWGGLGALGYAIHFYQQEYVIVKNELFAAINSNDPNYISPHGFNETQLRTVVDQTRRQRDFFVVMTAILYGLQMVDAHVDAHLKEFDLNPNLHVRVEPRITQDLMTGRTSGAAMIIRF